MTAISESRFWVLIGVLLAGGILINWFEQRGEATVVRRDLSEYNDTLGEWSQKGGDIRFSEQTESVLKASDYVMRDYVKEGRRANLYIGYYSSQRTGSTYHSPQNCLPGSGWEMRNPELVTIKTPGGRKFTANRYLIENGKYKEVMIYWYHGRGRSAASEYYDKLYTVWDGVVRRRSDGSMIRIMTVVGNSESDANLAAEDLAAQVADNLAEFIPD